MDLAIVINTVVFQYSELDFLMLMFDLLGGGVILLLAPLSATTESKNQVKSRFFLDVVVAQSTAILELFAGENQTLLIWRDSLLILDLGLDILDSV